MDHAFLLADAGVHAVHRAVRAAHLSQTRTILDAIPGGRLQGRGQEIAEMARFSVDPTRFYLVWHADAWSGKTALMATFAAEPPAGVDVVAFFVNANDPGARGVEQYLASIIGQFEALLDGPPPDAPLAIPGAALGRYMDLLARCAQDAADDNRCLVLLVDGLDEDMSRTETGLLSITEALPKSIPDLHVITATRPYENVLIALAADHPFRAAAAGRRLSASAHAADIRDRAAREIRDATMGPALEQQFSQDILGSMLAACDTLTIGDPCSLLGHDQGGAVTASAVRSQMQNQLQRTVRPRRRDEFDAADQTGDQEAYEWSHQTLPQAVREALGSQVAEQYGAGLQRWADHQVESGWNRWTPAYMESGYVTLLTDNHDTDRLFALAVDASRHEWLRRRRGGDEQALADVVSAFGLQRQIGHPRYRPPSFTRLPLRLLGRSERILSGGFAQNLDPFGSATALDRTSAQ